MPAVPGLRSSYDKVGRLVYFGRMLDKIRLHAAGRLPEEYQPNLGIGFDGRTCLFLEIDYRQLVEQVKQSGATDEEILAWCHRIGGPRSDEECTVWNRFMMKLGWRDDRSETLRARVAASGLSHPGRPIETFFDLNEYDEGRDPLATQPWLG